MLVRAAGMMAIAVCGAIPMLAQGGPNTVTIQRSVIATGATENATNGVTVISGTAGQTVIRVVTGPNLRAYQGFWTPQFTTSSVGTEGAAEAAGAFKLTNTPNPFQGATDIAFQITDRSHVRVSILDLNGAEVIRLADDTREPGEHRVAWDGRTARGEASPSGMYVCVLTVTPSGQGMDAPARYDRRKLMLTR